MKKTMTAAQQKYVSLAIAIVVVTLFSMLTGCTSEAEKAEAAQAKAAQIEATQAKAAQAEALRMFMHQGNGTVRKPGTSGFKSF